MGDIKIKKYNSKEDYKRIIEFLSNEYRKKGLCKQMIHGVINRCKELGIEKVFINSFDWRVKVYNSAGFKTEESIGFWYKKIR